MKDFIFHNPTKIIFGKTALQKLSENASVYGKKIALTYGKGSIKQNGLYDKVMAELKGFEVREFGGIEPNPRVETIRKAIEEFRDFNPDLILAVGGGSVIDGSKLISAALHYTGDPWDILINSPAKPKHYVPLATVLTFAATCSEMDSFAVITNWETHEKLAFSRDEVYPKFSILNPEFTYSVSREQTAYGLVDAFSHVLEQYLTISENVMLQDRWAESLLTTMKENALTVLENPTDYHYRSTAMYSATMALNGFISMGVNQDWATHEIEHELSAFYDIPHGAGLAIITPRWMRVMKAEKLPKLAQFGRRVWGLAGDEDEMAEGAIQKTFDFFESLGIRMNAAEWGITDEHFPVMTGRLEERQVGEIPLTVKQIRAILTSI
ncbi:MAG: iron-containing alcohol dehydrogenase [Patescibacteria group bacterium]